jgi:hypothetical protein
VRVNPLETFRQMGLYALLTMVISVLPLAVGALYAARPSEARLALMRPFTLAALFAGLSGTCQGLVHVFRGLSATSTLASGWPPRIYAGMTEAMVPASFGLTCLTVAWLLVAIGLWRGVRET